MQTLLDVRTRLASIAGAALACWLLLRLLTSTRWFDLYGTALVALVAAPLIGHALWRGLAINRRPRWLAVAVAAPVGVAALVQIGFWIAYFSSAKTGIQVGMGRLMFQLHVAEFLPFALVIFGILAVWIFTLSTFRRAPEADIENTDE